MGEKYKGKTMALSTRRRLVGEILHHARKLPSLPLARDCNIASLIAVRSRLAEPPSWIAIFMKAYALVALHFSTVARCTFQPTFTPVEKRGMSNDADLTRTCSDARVLFRYPGHGFFLFTSLDEKDS